MSLVGQAVWPLQHRVGAFYEESIVHLESIKSPLRLLDILLQCNNGAYSEQNATP